MKNKNNKKESIAMPLTAGEGELTKWLTNPPKESHMWKKNNQPLLRCCELDRGDLFKKWHNWGCDRVITMGTLSRSLSFTFDYQKRDKTQETHFKRVYFDEMIDANPNSVLWLLDCERESFTHGIGQLVREARMDLLNKINWDVVLNNLNHEEISTITMWSLINKKQFVSLSKSLELLNGELDQDNYMKIKTTIGNIDYFSEFYGASDVEVANRIDMIETGVLKSIDWKLLKNINMPLSMQSALEQVKLNSFEVRKTKKDSPANWIKFFENIGKMEKSFNVKKMNVKDGEKIIDDLIECGIDFGKFDKNKTQKITAYDGLAGLAVRSNIDENVIYAMAKKINDIKPQLVVTHLKMRPAKDYNNIKREAYYNFLNSLFSKQNLENARRHQFAKKHKKKTSDIVVPRKKRVM